MEDGMLAVKGAFQHVQTTSGHQVRVDSFAPDIGCNVCFLGTHDYFWNTMTYTMATTHFPNDRAVLVYPNARKTLNHLMGRRIPSVISVTIFLAASLSE